MFSIDKVLVPVSFSADSEATVNYAIGLARPHNARLIFLHVINQDIIDSIQQSSDKGYKGDFVRGVRNLVAEREADLRRLVPESCREELEVEFSVRKGAPAEKIIQAATDLSVKLVVLGTSAQSSEFPASLGNTTREVIDASPCPVLLVRPFSGE